METVWIRVSGGDEVAELAELIGHLRTERGLAGLVRAERSAVGPEDLGGALDVVAVAIGSGGVVAVLAQSLSGWVKSRRPPVKFTLSTRDGLTLELEATADADADRLIRELLRHVDDDD